jgi:hypothetical protein
MFSVKTKLLRLLTMFKPVGVGVGVGEIKGKYAIYMLCNPIKATLIGMSGKGFKVKG